MNIIIIDSGNVSVSDEVFVVYKTRTNIAEESKLNL